MITSLTTSLIRVILAWYGIGLLVFFLGDPAWAQSVYTRLVHYPFVPRFPVAGLSTAGAVQITLLSYWTLPLFVLLAGQLGAAYALAHFRVSGKLQDQKDALAPRGEFCLVKIPGFSVGNLAMPVVPKRKTKHPIKFVTENGALIGPPTKEQYVGLPVIEDVAAVLTDCTPEELQLCAELVELLSSYEGHYAGAGHGVDLLDHTFNVALEAVGRCTPEFRLPLVAALAHDIGKLITFKKTQDGWVRKGYHSREGARILASLPAFSALPLSDQRALILALKYEHTSNALPTLGGDVQATKTATRLLFALTASDKTATAAEKDRNLIKIQPEDLLWKDFVDNFFNVPVLQMGKKNNKNQINNPRGPYVYLYEVTWREAAIARLPEEIAAVLDLNRRDTGRIAKYTRILVDRFRKEGLLIEEHEGMKVPADNALWNIRSGMIGKDLDQGIAINGVIALNSTALWTYLDRRLPVFSDFNVRIESPNADGSGTVYTTVQDARSVPQLADKMSLGASVAQTNKDNSGAAKPTVVGSAIDRLDEKTVAQIGLVSKETVASTATTRTASRRFSTQDTSAPDHLHVDVAKSPVRKVSPDHVQVKPTAPAAPPLPPPTVHSAITAAFLATASTTETVSPSVAPTPAIAPTIDPPAPSMEVKAIGVAPDSPVVVPEPLAGLSEDPVLAQVLAQESYEAQIAGADRSALADVSALGSYQEVDPLPDVLPDADDDADPQLVPLELAPGLALGLSWGEPVETPEITTDASQEATRSKRGGGAESRQGIAAADAQALALYPHLTPGEKYYTNNAPLVQTGMKQAGAVFNTPSIPLEPVTSQGRKPSFSSTPRPPPAQSKSAALPASPAARAATPKIPAPDSSQMRARKRFS